MASNFSFIKLKDICVKITKGSTPTKKDGGFSEQGINFIKAESASYDGVLDESKFTFVTEGIYEKYKRSQLEENDILFSMAGAFLGKTGLVEKKHLPANTNQALALIRVDSSRANPKFVLYSLQQRRIVHFVNNSISQSAQPNINLQQIGDLDIEFPARDIQDSIVNVLDSIVQRTLVNRQTNQTLEQMAQALFKSWFVDFDPVIDNALAAGNAIPDELQHRVEIRKKAHALQKQNPNIKPLPEATQHLFPSEFEYCGDNTLGIHGWMPQGWEIKELSQIVKHQKGFAFKSSWYQDEGHIVVRVSDTTHDSIDVNSCNKISPELAVEYSAYALKVNDVVIASVGSWPPNYSSVVGKVIRVPSTAEGGLLNQNAVKLTVSNEYSFHQGFLYMYLKNSRFMEYIVNRAQGSANQASITLKSIFNFPILLANPEVMRAFSVQVKLNFEKQDFNSSQTEVLTKLRDSLLPKLISGEITT